MYTFDNMEKQKYEAPAIKELGDAKSIIKNVFISGGGDTFPGTEETLKSN